MVSTANPQPAALSEPAPMPASSRTYGHIAARGMMWMMLNSVFAKSVGFGAQIILGWLLSQDDYAVFALAIAVYGLLATFRDGGLQKILIQRGKEYDSLASPVFRMALCFNLAFAALLAACSPVAASYFGTPKLAPMLWVLGLTAILSTPTIVFQARLLRDLRFGLVTRITASATVINYASMVLLAVMGLGPLSFVIPGAIVATYEGLAYGMATGFLPNRNPLTMPMFRNLLRASAWIMFGALATTLINGGDYLVIGGLRKADLGYYTFGFQFSASFAVLFAVGARSVLMPTLTQFCDQIERFGSAYLRSARLLAFVGTPVCVAVTLVIAPLVDFLWQGKWNAAIAVIQIMTMSLIFRLLTPVALAALEARGRWKLQSILLMIDGIGTVVAASIGCLIGGLVPITVSIAVNRAIMALIQCLAAGSLGELSAARILQALWPPVAIAALCGMASYLLAGSIASKGSWTHAAVATSVFAALFTTVAWALMRSRVQEVLSLVNNLVLRRSAAVSAG